MPVVYNSNQSTFFPNSLDGFQLTSKTPFYCEVTNQKQAFRLHAVNAQEVLIWALFLKLGIKIPPFAVYTQAPEALHQLFPAQTKIYMLTGKIKGEIPINFHQVQFLEQQFAAHFFMQGAGIEALEELLIVDDDIYCMRPQSFLRSSDLHCEDDLVKFRATPPFTEIFAQLSEESVLTQIASFIEQHATILNTALEIHAIIPLDNFDKIYNQLVRRIHHLAKQNPSLDKVSLPNFIEISRDIFKQQLSQTFFYRRFNQDELQQRVEAFNQYSAEQDISFIQFISQSKKDSLPAPLLAQEEGYSLSELHIDFLTKKTPENTLEEKIADLEKTYKILRNPEADLSPQQIQIIIKIINAERYYKKRNYVTCYHAIPSSVGILYDIYNVLNKHFRLFTLPYKNFPTLQTFIEHFENIEKEYNKPVPVIDNYSEDYPEMGLSFNPFLFGSIREPYSSSVNLFYMQNSPKKHKDWPKTLTRMGMNQSQIDEDLTYLVSLEKMRAGRNNMYQIHIPGKEIDTYAYPAQADGPIYESNTTLTALLTEFESSVKTAKPDTAKYQACTRMALNLQGRLFLHPSAFKKAVILKYSSCSVDASAQKQYETSIYQYAKKLFFFILQARFLPQITLGPCIPDQLYYAKMRELTGFCAPRDLLNQFQIAIKHAHYTIRYIIDELIDSFEDDQVAQQRFTESITSENLHLLLVSLSPNQIQKLIPYFTQHWLSIITSVEEYKKVCRLLSRAQVKALYPILEEHLLSKAITLKDIGVLMQFSLDHLDNIAQKKKETITTLLQSFEDFKSLLFESRSTTATTSFSRQKVVCVRRTTGCVI